MDSIKFLQGTPTVADSKEEAHFSNAYKDMTCAVVGSSGAVLKKEDGELIDKHDVVIRCNNAPTQKYERHVGSRTDIRVINCHLCWSLESTDKNYLKHLTDRMPAFEPKYLYQLKNELLIIKDGVNPGTFVNQKKSLEGNGCRVSFMNSAFYSGISNMSGDHATNGFVAIMFAIRHFKKVSCFGFTFGREWGKDWNNFHYYQELKKMGNEESCHNGSKEEEIILSYAQNNPDIFLQRY